VADILVVEDEAVIRSALRRFLERNKYCVAEAASVSEAQEKIRFDNFSLIISDLRLPGASGTDLIKLAGDVPVLIMTSYASLRSAVDAMRAGAVDYIAKPFDYEDLLAAIRRIIREHAERPGVRRHGAQSAPDEAIEGLIGSCPAMLGVYERIRKVAPTQATVLIRGETGTGKELVARAIHRASRRAAQPLICVNCAAIPETLIESELFGYEKGAFTGASSNRMGLIEAAEGGTLFLDEIGELPCEAQARLLRFIQEGEIRAIGSVQSRRVDVRLITATHRDLKALCEQGRFRQDLYYRINVLELALPPLRERGRDIIAIAETLLERACERLGKPLLRFSPDAIQAILSYRWPGNVRELENAVERAAILCEQDEIPNELLSIDLELVDVEEFDDAPEHVTGVESRAGSEDPTEDLSLEEYFQRFVLQHQDHMSETELARKLGVSRKCLWERRQRFGLPRKKSATESESQPTGRRSA
jgi:DNA-binding NtrC family response regulator